MSAPATATVRAKPGASGRWLLGPLLFALLAALALDITMGDPGVAQVVPPSLVLKVLTRHIAPPISDRVGRPGPPPAYLEGLIWDGRVPRALSGAVIGMLLAMAGVAFQSLLMNPLADPYMVGVSAGSALGSAVAILCGAAGLLGGFAQPLAAFATGLLAMIAVSMLARVAGRISPQTFLLAGVVVGTFLWSLIPLMLSLANRAGNLDRQGAILAQLLGSLQFVGWREVGLLVPFAVVGISVLALSTRELNVMALGEETAAHLGVNTEAFKRRVIVAGSLVTAAAVSAAGIIAFVGLIVPHIARRLTGPDHSVLLPSALLLGGLAIVLADWISRVFLNSLEIGVITSLLGAPVFCALLRARARDATPSRLL